MRYMVRQAYKQWPQAKLPGWGEASGYTPPVCGRDHCFHQRDAGLPLCPQGAQPSGSAQTAQQLHTGSTNPSWSRVVWGAQNIASGTLKSLG